MEKIIKKIIGKTEHTFIVSGADFHEVIMKSKNLSFPNIYKCGICSSDNLLLNAHITPRKKHKYAHIDCMKCGAQLNFGVQQENTEVFYLRPVKEGDKIKKDEQGNSVYDWKSREQAQANEE
jgi:transcription elongation factor Elf1